MKHDITPSRSRKFLKAFSQVFLLGAGFVFVLFTESTKSSHVTPAGFGGVAHADAPYSSAGDSGASGGDSGSGK